LKDIYLGYPNTAGSCIVRAVYNCHLYIAARWAVRAGVFAAVPPAVGPGGRCMLNSVDP
jgi:hypothetical protein